MTSAHATLRLLGGIDWTPAPPQGAPRLGRKPQALLALVAAHGTRGVTRDRLARAIWADSDERAGGAALRQCLMLLRRSLGAAAEAIDVRRDRIALRAPLADTFEFEHLVAKADARSLESATALYRGDFCEGFDALDGEVMRSIEVERTRLRALAHQVVARSSTRESDPALDEAAIALAHRLLARDPLHEGCHRALMILLERGGMRAEALHVFETCTRVLRDELDVEPSNETTAVAERIRAAGPRRSVHSPSAPSHTTIARIFHSQAAPAAVDRLVRAWQLFGGFTAETNRLSRLEAEAAAAIDPTYIEAIVILGWTHMFDWITGWSRDPEESYRHACVQLERGHSVGRVTSGLCQLESGLLIWKHRHDDALELARRAVSIAPEFGLAQFSLGSALLYAGRHEEAKRLIAHARVLDPNELGVFRNLASLADFLCGDSRAAKRGAEGAIARCPTYPWAHWSLAVAESDLGNYEAARAAARTARDLAPRMGMGFPADRYLPLRLERDRERLAAAVAKIGDGIRYPPYEGDDTVVSIKPGGRIRALGSGGRAGRDA